MELKDLRSGMFGFKKDDVCEYIAELNSTFSKQLADQQAESKELLARLSDKNEELHTEIAKLETYIDGLKHAAEEKDKEIQKLKSEIDTLQKQSLSARQHDSVIVTLTEGKNRLHRKTVAENEAISRPNRRKTEMDAYGKCAEKVKDTIAAALASIKIQIAKLDKQISSLQYGKDGESSHEK